MSRRGTDIGKMLLEYPQLLRLSQWGVLTAEVLSPLLLVLRGRLLAAGLLFFGCFHLFTWLAIRIHFLPTVVCLLAFVPLERIPDLLAGRLRLPWVKARAFNRAVVKIVVKPWRISRSVVNTATRKKRRHPSRRSTQPVVKIVVDRTRVA